MTFDLSTVGLGDFWPFSTIDLVTLDLSTSDLIYSLSYRQVIFYISDLLTVDLLVS